MFFINRSKEKLLNEIKEGIHASEQETVAGNKQLEQLSQNLTQNFTQLQSSVRKHNIAIEDLLDEWSERHSDETYVKDKIKELTQNENHLLKLFEAYQEQFWNFKRFAEMKDEAWASQISVMEQNLEHYRLLCGIKVINEIGIHVDYDFHEVIEAIETADIQQDKLVANIYRCGYIYKGKVIKKAQIAAYRAKNQDKPIL